MWDRAASRRPRKSAVSGSQVESRREVIMTDALARVVADDRGMSTAEYAVGTVAAVGFGVLLVKLLSSPEAQRLLWGLIERALSWVFG